VNPLADAAGPAPSADKRTGFFGLTIESKRVVFVIDISGSMKENVGGAGPDAKSKKSDLAKAELKRVLASLEDGALFDIVFFSSAVRVWKPDMQVSDQKTRKEAVDFVDAAEVVGGTNTYDALEAAFAIGDMGKGKKREADPTGDARVDSIVFLSDGKPSVGRTTDPDAIRTAVKGWNRARRIAISAIAFGAEKDAVDPKFMKGLADDTGGKFVQK
jgi:Mg-chelatase subunit ChlD